MNPNQNQKKGNRGFFILIVLVTALILLLGSVFWWQEVNQPLDKGAEAPYSVFVIKKGESLDSIARRLQNEGLIKSSLAFRIIVIKNGLSENIQAGGFKLRPSMEPAKIAETLTHGTLDIWLTFPEGWRREEIGRRLQANLDQFDLEEYLVLTQKFEGYLFPDTYLIPKNTDPAAVIKMMTQNFQKQFDESLKLLAESKGLTEEEVVILASIVEREVAQDQDRPLVAGILIKRWQNDWPLQADATIQYALVSASLTVVETPSFDDFDWWPTVKKENLEVDSLYNTYLHRGLPPAPICNPGLASIKAVIQPQESDYWFYLSDDLGVTHYAQDDREHQENINQYLK